MICNTNSLDGPLQRPTSSSLKDGWYWFYSDTYTVPKTGHKFRAYVMGGETLVDGRRYAVDTWKGAAKVFGPVPEGEREEPKGLKGWRDL